MRALTRPERVVLLAIATVTAVAGVARYSDVSKVLAFALAGFALAGLAWIVSFGTEQVGQRLGPAATGLLQSTLGNLPEFFVVLFALGQGQQVVAQTSLVGSILANALLVLGLVIVVGARRARDGVMRFNPRLPSDTATLLLLASVIIVILGLSIASADKASHHVRTISAVGAGCILAVYLAWVIPYVRSGAAGEPAVAPRVPLSLAAGMLAVGGVGSAFVSDWFINALEPAIRALDISHAFAGLVIVAIAGNAVENVTGLVLAHKDQSDLAISVVKNSVAQVAAFLFPVLVLVSLAFTTPLTFSLAPVYIGSILLTALVVWQVTGDGSASAFEGWALVAVYVIVAVVTLYE
jgi:Ca2+:H+ antiporter